MKRLRKIQAAEGDSSKLADTFLDQFVADTSAGYTYNIKKDKLLHSIKQPILVVEY